MQHTRQRLIGTTILVALLAVGTFWATPESPPVEAGANWFVYLYNSANNSLLRVDRDGTQQSYSLGLDADSYAGGFNMAFTPDGSQLAFCVDRYADFQSVFRIRDIVGETDRLELDFGGAIGCSSSPQSITPDGRKVAVSVVNYYPGDPNTDPGTGAAIWQIFVVDVATGATLYELSDQSPALAAAGLTPGQATLPRVTYFDRDLIAFAEVPYGIGGAPEFPAFLWRLDSNTLEPIERYGKAFLETSNETGELAWLDVDPDLPRGEPGGPLPPNNVLRVADKTGSVRTVYHSPDWIMTDLEFINGGQQLAVLLQGPFDSSRPYEQPARWMAVGRDGAVTELARFEVYADVAAAPGGFVLLDVTYQGGGLDNPLTQLEYHAGGDVAQLWQSEDEGWEIAWALPIAVSSPPPPFTAAVP